MVRQSRREFLSTVGLVGIAGIAGCASRSLEIASVTEYDRQNDRSTSEFSLVAAFTPGRRRPGGIYGRAVALGDRFAAVGYPATPSLDAPSGAVHIFERTGDGWRRDALLTSPGDEPHFGAAVAIEDGTALVTEYRSGDGADPGHLVGHVYERTAGRWAHRTELVPADPRPADNLGLFSAQIDGDTAVMGFTERPYEGVFPVTRRVYAFSRGDDGWRRDGPLEGGSQGLMYGGSVSLDGGRILVGDQERAHVYARSDDGWDHRARLTPDSDPDAGRFGHPVALAGDAALVGTFGGSDGEWGSVLAFGRGPDGWRQSARLVPDPNGHRHAVALSPGGQTALVGAVDSPFIEPPTGSVRPFVRSGGTWTQGPTLDTGPVGRRGWWVGLSAATTDEYALVGAPASSSDRTSAALLYERTR